MTERKKEGLCALERISTAVGLLLCLRFVWKLEGLSLQRVLLMVLAALWALRMLTGCIFELAGKDRERDWMERSAKVFRQAWTQRQIDLYEIVMTLLGMGVKILLPIWLYTACV